MLNLSKYFLPKNYQANPAISYDLEKKKMNYWNPERTKKSISYQWAAYQWANEIIRNKGISTVADVGCGLAHKLNKLYLDNPNIEFWGIDQPNAIVKCKKHYNFGNWLGINLENNPILPHKKFGLVISSDVIEHLNDPDILIDYIKKIVLEDGYILITTLERDILRGTGFLNSPNKAHTREWNTKEFTLYLQSHGLEILSQKLLPAQKFMFNKHYLTKLIKRLLKFKSMRYNQAYLLKVKQK